MPVAPSAVAAAGIKGIVADYPSIAQVKMTA
jgi:hypothetical protein